jgi:hypothetical protein
MREYGVNFGDSVTIGIFYGNFLLAVRATTLLTPLVIYTPPLVHLKLLECPGMLKTQSLQEHIKSAKVIYQNHTTNFRSE